MQLKRKSEAETQASIAEGFNLEETPVAVNAWSGLRQDFSSNKTPGLEELLGAGMTYVAWDGVETKPILDKAG